MKLDYLTVAFQGDARLLRLQARSMARYLDPASTGAVIVVNNEAERERFRDWFESAVRPEYGTLAPLVRLVEDTALLPGPPRGTGYRRQQAIKLLAHRIVGTDCYLTLDAKNILIRPLRAADFLDAEGRCIARHRKLAEHLTGALRLFGVPPEAMPEAIPDIYTPFGLWRDACAGLEAHVAARLGTDLATLICEAPHDGARPIYEYLLYSAWLHAHGGGIAARHSLTRRRLSLTWLCNDPKVGPGAILDLLDDTGHRIIGVHRRIQRRTPEEQARIAEVLLRFGLVESVEEGLAFLAPA